MRLLVNLLAVFIFAVTGCDKPSAPSLPVAEFNELEELQEAAANGDPVAQRKLGIAYIEGNLGLSPSRESAIDWLSKASDSDDAVAQFNLGLLFEKGPKEDQKKSMALFEQAASQGHLNAKVRLARHLRGDFKTMERAGELVREVLAVDSQTISEWQRLDTAHKSEAKYGVGLSFSKGFGLYEGNEDQAIPYFQSAADEGHAEAAYELGRIYESYKSDVDVAFQWYLKGAEGGYVSAQTRVAWLFSQGKGTEKDASKAEMYYRRAADQGYWEGQWNLANALFEKGSNSWEEAYRYFEMAAKGGPMRLESLAATAFMTRPNRSVKKV
jgi:uncharacterized protein